MGQATLLCRDPHYSGSHGCGETQELVVVPVVVRPVVAAVIAVTTAALARLSELLAAFLRLAAALTVALDLLMEVCFGLSDALGAFVVPVACLRGRSPTKQQEPAQGRREQRGLS